MTHRRNEATLAKLLELKFHYLSRL